MKMMGINPLIFIGLYLVSSVYCVPDAKRDQRFSIFQIIKFENSPCIGGTRNGTCFTEAECEDAGGTTDGECADGFGVCCITKLADGQATSLNQSYIVQESTSSITAGAKKYTICPCSADVCRIRFDFTDFTLAAPVTDPGTTAAGSLLIHGQSIGDCTEDTFSITSSASAGSPVICGTNTGQHMIVDSDGNGCSVVNVGIGSGTSTRSYDIMVTQYRCGDESGGPPGCLQYFTGETGSVRSFNFPNQAAGTAVAVSVVHLSNQHYTACIRKPAGKTHICYIPCTSVDPAIGAISMSSFGISLGNDAAVKSNEGTTCLQDALIIPGGDTSVIAAAGIASLNSRFCGRELNTVLDIAWIAGTSVCTSSVPFTIGVEFDEDEVTADANTANACEAALNPGGIVGFSLCYTTL